MLLTVAIMGLLVQSPQDVDMKIWVDRGFDPQHPSAVTVSGTPELSRDAAWAAANRNSAETYRERVQGLAQRRIASVAPAWLPGFVREKVVRDWTRSQVHKSQPRVLDRDLIVRDHGFGLSYQAFLLLDQADPSTAVNTASLTRRLKQEKNRFITRCGSVVGFWGVLALLMSLLDRLTRGYMTGRLYVIGAALGLAAPILLVVA